MIKVNIDQGSEAWYQIRLGRITGTRFKDLVAGESTKTYQDLITDIAGEIITQTGEETYSNALMERGKELEPEAAKEYESIFDIESEEVGFCLFDEDDKFHDWVGVSPDRLIGEDGGLEIKCPLRKTHINYIKANRLPAEYIKQVQGCLFVTSRKWWDFMSYYPGMKPFIIRVYPDLELHKIFIERLEKFINDVKQEIKAYNVYDIFMS